MKTKNLFAILAVFIGAVFSGQAQVNQITSTQVKELITKQKKIIVLDVRTAEEFNEGHIKGAINIDVRQPDFATKVDKLNKNGNYLVHCRTNHRSTMAVNQMMQSGFKTIYQMMDGFAGWSANGLPIQR